LDEYKPHPKEYPEKQVKEENQKALEDASAPPVFTDGLKYCKAAGNAKNNTNQYACVKTNAKWFDRTIADFNSLVGFYAQIHHEVKDNEPEKNGCSNCRESEDHTAQIARRLFWWNLTHRKHPT
jgi:hypothetical protein